MDVVTSFHQDSIHGDINHIDTETPRQEPQWMCTRNSPCLQQGFMICSTLINHVCNLDMALNSDHASQTSLITAACPLPTSHAILFLTFAFQLAIQKNNTEEINHLYNQNLKSNLDFILYDRSDLGATQQIAMNLLNSHIATSTPLPNSPPNGWVPAHPAPPPSASFKAPKLFTDNCYDFYPWLSSVQNSFTLTRCNDPAKLVLTLQAIPLNKRCFFNNITNWTSFKTRLIEEFGSIDIFGRDVNKIFYLFPCYESVQEVAEDLSPKIKTLLANLEIIQQFHEVEDLHNVALTLNLVQTSWRASLWKWCHPSTISSWSSEAKTLPTSDPLPCSSS